MTERAHEILNCILEGTSGKALHESLCELRESRRNMEVFINEVAIHSKVSGVQTPLVVDGFLIEDLYQGRLASLLALQVCRILIEQDTKWDLFEKIHIANQFADSYDDVQASSKDDDLLHESTVGYGNEIELFQFSPSDGSQHILPSQPRATFESRLQDNREKYLSGEENKTREIVKYHQGQYELAISWWPETANVHLQFLPPQCSEKEFMKGIILLQTSEKAIAPDRRDYSNIVANAFFNDISPPWGARLLIEPNLIPELSRFT